MLLYISRVKTLASCVVEPMTLERLISLSLSKMLEYRIKEARLDNLAKATLAAVSNDF